MEVHAMETASAESVLREEKVKLNKKERLELKKN